MNHSRLLLGLVALCSVVISCASPRVAYKKGFDFSQIRTVRISGFTSAAAQSNAGAVVANEFVRQLLSGGYSVVSADSAASDVVLEGNVMEYLPNHRYLIQDVSQDQSKQVIVTYPPVELSGSNVYNQGTAFGIGEGNKIIVSNATVGISAFLKDAHTGEIIWSNTYTYEGLDLNTALEGAVGYLLRSWPAKR